MMVRFKSEVGGFVMFGNVAVTLLRMSGHSGTVPGAFAADDIAQALARLEAQLLAQTPAGKPDAAAAADNHSDNDDNDSETPVSLAQRAFALIELMRRAAAEPCAIQWHED